MNHRRIRNGSIALILLFIFSFVGVAETAEPQFEVEMTAIRVYRDGLTHITQTLISDSLFPQINVPLLSSSIENIIVLDENELAVDYKQNENNLTIYTLGTTRLSVEYDTTALTNKEADVWTLILNTPYNLTVILPNNSTIVYLNQVPAIIDMTGNELSLSLYPAQWEISYIMPLTIDSQNGGDHFLSIPTEHLVAAIIAAIAITLILVILVWRRKKINVKNILNRNPGLMKEDIAVIEFLAEKEGKAFEAEIRQKFPDMPRTSLWRLVRRLEGLEIVEVKKIGLENQVQLKK